MERGRWLGRAFVGTVLAVLCALAGFSILTEQGMADQAARAKSASRLSQLYVDARFWAGQQQSLARKYRLDPTHAVLVLHSEAERHLTADLTGIVGADHSSASRRLWQEQAEYVRESATMFQAAGVPHSPREVNHDRAIVKPVIDALQAGVGAGSRASARNIAQEAELLRRDTRTATRAIAIAFAFALALLILLTLVARNFRRRELSLDRAEVDRLRHAALVDSLTGLRNRRAFHEDLGRDLAWAARTGRPLALSN